MSNIIKKQTLAPAEKRMRELGLDPADVTREMGYALAIINGSDKLQKCDPVSIVSSIIAAASTGLTLNPAKQHACLIPRWTREATICEFQPMYRGLMFLAVEEGAATKFNVQAVHERDRFLAQPDNDQQPVHHEFTGFDRGAVVGYYSVATMLDGTKVAEFMSVEDIHRVRACSDGYRAFVAEKIKSHPWNSNEGEMSRKTIVKRQIKRLPSGKADSKLYAAVEIDNRDYQAIETEATKPRAPELPTLTTDHEDYPKCVEALAKGYKLDAIRKRFTLSEEVEDALLVAATSMQLSQETQNEDQDA